jgi:choline dehydrogenase-like flavoprotein
MAQAPYATRKEEDFVVVGSGAAGGIMAKENATAGFSVVVAQPDGADSRHRFCRLAAQQLLGTCRMGNDPGSSVVDKYKRAHEVPSLFMVDGSSRPWPARMTIMALAFRAADHLIQAAQRLEI